MTMRRSFLAIAALALAACADDGRAPLAAPASGGQWLAVAVRCQVEPGARTARCGSSVSGRGSSATAARTRAQHALAARGATAAPGAMNAVIFGSQDEQLRVEVQDLRQTVAGDTTTLTLAVRNLLAQPIGTLDGATADVKGVQLFFAQLPTATGGTGTVRVAAVPDSSTFPPFSGRVPYLPLPGLLAPGATAVTSVSFDAPTSVTAWTFDLLAQAEVPSGFAGAGTSDIGRLSIAPTGQHACLVGNDNAGGSGSGLVWCWGSGRNLALGTAVDSASPTALPLDGFRFRSVDSFGPSACGITVEARAYCWGQSTAYALNIYYDGPFPVLPGLHLAQLSMGDSHVCGVALDGTAWCQGDNSYGQLGGTGTAAAPVRVAGGLRWREVRAGASHTCGIATDSVAYCWGDNGSGGVGDGTFTSRAQPRPVVGGLRFTSLRLGSGFTCGISTAADVWCWGSDAYGTLGQGAPVSGNQSAQPVRVVGLSGVTVLAAGNQHVCAAAGTVTSCWGSDQDGEAGASSPTVFYAPNVVQSRVAYVELSASRTGAGVHVCGRTAAQQVECWGANRFAQLGTGSAFLRSPVPLAATQLAGATVVAIEGASCSATAAGLTSCVGDNNAGQLGRMAYITGRFRPQAIFGGDEVAAGEDFTCSIAGLVYCWGNNAYGQLGNGSGSDARVPTAIPGAVGYFGIAAGARHACAFTFTSRTVTVCWGGNGDGQAGVGVVTGVVPTPQLVVDTSGAVAPVFQQLALGTYHSCALDLQGAAWCWGFNGDGQLGTGNTVTAVAATPVNTTVRFSKLAAGQQNTCGISTQGALYCWGSNAAGVLGVPALASSTTPVPVQASLQFRDVAVGVTHACALTTGGYAYCWGQNVQGELGIKAANPLSPAGAPTRVLGDRIFTEIRVGLNFTCAIERAADLRPWCWGEPSSLGLGYVGSQFVPRALDLPARRQPLSSGL